MPFVLARFVRATTRLPDPSLRNNPDLKYPPVINRPLDVDEGERIQVARFELRGYTDREELGISREELEALLAQKQSERPDGFTVGHLQEVAVEVTRYYRSKGLILAQAFVPVQTVSDGVVEIEVMEGRLGEVLTEGTEFLPANC